MNKQVSIAEEVLGITDRYDTAAALQQSQLTLTGEVPSQLELQRLVHAPEELRSVTDLERCTDLQVVSEILTSEKSETATTLTDWWSYHSMLRRYGTRANGAATALMVGSMCSLSSRAFECLAKSEYGAGHAFVVDPIGGTHKARHGTFVYGSGLNLPFASGSMNFVHTNQLLHKLVDPSSPSRPFRQRALLLFAEIARVLAPGGQLLMKEVVPGATDDLPIKRGIGHIFYETQRLCSFVTSALQKFGFAKTKTQLTEVHDKVNYLFDPKRDFSKHPPTGFNAAIIDIYAQLPQSAVRTMPSSQESL